MAALFAELNWLAVLIATVAYFILGGLWYSKLLFADTWMKLRGIKEEDLDGPNPIIFLYAFLLEFIAVVSLALFITAMGISGALHGLIIGLGAGAGFVFTLAGTTGIFSESKLALHLLDNGHHVVGLCIAGAILGAW